MSNNCGLARCDGGLSSLEVEYMYVISFAITIKVTEVTEVFYLLHVDESKTYKDCIVSVSVKRSDVIGLFRVLLQN